MDEPRRYDDPYYVNLASVNEEKFGLPAGLLSSIITKGEKSHADQVSSAGAKTVAQIIPATRAATLEKWGIDAYLSGANALEVAARLLKDSLARNGGDVETAVREYHGGTNRKNWGPVNDAYARRVMEGVGVTPAAAEAPAPGTAEAAAPAQSTFERVSADMAPSQATSLATVVDAYKAGRMSPDDAKAFEAEVSAGRVMLPRGVTLNSEPNAPTVPAAVADAYYSGRMTPQDRAEVDRLVQGGVITIPAPTRGVAAIPGHSGERVPLPPERAPYSLGEKIVGTGEGLLQMVTGIPGYAAGLVGGAAQMVEDVKGIAREGAAYKPAQSVDQAFGKGAQALTYSPRTEAGQALGSDIAAFAANAVPLAGLPAEMAAGARAAANSRRAVGDATRGRLVAAGTEPVDLAASPAVDAPVAPAVAPLAAEQLVQTAKKASGGGIGSTKATTTLAEQAAPDPKVVQSAKRLGIDEYLQPDHVTTNQSFRELAQAVKSVPGSQARTSELTGLERVAARADKLIDEIGGTSDISVLNADVKGRMAATVSELEGRADALYAQVRKQIPLKAPAPAASVLEFIAQRADELGGTQNLSAMEKRVLSRLTPKRETVEIAVDAGAARRQASRVSTPSEIRAEANRDSAAGLMVGQGQRTAVPRPQPIEVLREPTYALLDDVRRDVGSALKRSGPFKDADSGLAKKLYELITEDQAAVVGSHGATELYNAARQAVSLRKNIESDMQSLFGKAIDGSIAGTLPGAMHAAGQGNTAPLLKMLKAVPDTMRQEVVASGLATAFRTAGTRGSINFGTFSKWFDGLKANRQAYTAVMSNLPAPARRQVLDLYRVSDAISAATRERITTGRINAITDQFKVADSLAARLYDSAARNALATAAGTVTGSVAGPGVGAAVTSAMMKGPKPSALVAVDKLLVSPEFVDAVKATGTPGQTAASSRLVASPDFRRFLRSIGRQRMPHRDAQRWAERSMQAAPAGAAGGQDHRIDPPGF